MLERGVQRLEHAAQVVAIALRIAGPMIGNSASASGRGLRRTEAEIVSSIVGASALQVRIVRPQLDRGREDAAHVTRLRG